MSSKTVLIVDDDADIRDALTDVLEYEGYSVACSADGIEALAYLRANPPPGLILLDWMMPRCDGSQFRKEQCADPAISDIPVVLLTADQRLDEKALELAAGDYLKKPVTLDRLLEAVRRHCG